VTKVTGKTIWRAGVRTEIGKAAALALANEGATATLTGRRRDPLQDVIKQIALSATADIQPVGLMDFEHVRTIGGMSATSTIASTV
jgi:NADP-dependent 3-hydroxy acid dehydrogenase YdfG